MNRDDADELINNLILLINGQIELEILKQILIPSYTDINGNSYFHFLSEYSFKEFCLRNLKLNNKDKKIITFEEYNKTKDEYKQQIISFIKTLLEVNCDLLCVNNNNQNPLLLNIINKNYIISKEYLKVLQNLGIYTNEEYYNFLDMIIKNGNCFDQDCIELIDLILSDIDKKVYIEPAKNNLTPLFISLCKNFSQNIYLKYNEIVKIVSLEYIYKYNNNIYVKEGENIIENVKKKSFELLNDYINKFFMPLIRKFIKLGANSEYQKESAFIYLMSYPFFSDLHYFIAENKININFEDESGNTPLTNLLNNRENIIQISKDIFDKSYKYLLNNINLDMSNKNNKGKSIFYLCLIRDYYKEAKFIYHKFKNTNISFFNSIILNILLKIKTQKKL